MLKFVAGFLEEKKQSLSRKGVFVFLSVFGNRQNRSGKKQSLRKKGLSLFLSVFGHRQNRSGNQSLIRKGVSVFYQFSDTVISYTSGFLFTIPQWKYLTSYAFLGEGGTTHLYYFHVVGVASNIHFWSDSSALKILSTISRYHSWFNFLS